MNRRKFLTLIGSFSAIALVNPAGLLVNLETIRCAKMLGDALEREFIGMIKFAEKMARPGVSFSPEQQGRVKALVEAGDTIEAQRLILDRLNEEAWVQQ